MHKHTFNIALPSILKYNNKQELENQFGQTRP